MPSETSFLLPEGLNGGGVRRCSVPSIGSLELRSFTAEERNEDHDDDYCRDDLEDFSALLQRNGNKTQPHPQPSRRAVAHRATLVLGILACGFAIRLIGLTPNSNTTNASAATTTTTTDTTKFNGSLLGSSSSSSSSYWDDDAHQTWEDFLVNSHHQAERQGQEERSQKSSAADLGVVAGGLLLGSATTTTTTTTEVRSAVKIPSASSNLLYFNQSSAFGMVDPLESDFFHYQNGWEAQITQALCAIATTAALLNSLRDVGPHYKLPMDPVYKPFHWATQTNLLDSAATNSCVTTALGGTRANAESVYHMGLGLGMVPPLMNCFLNQNGYEATGHPAVDNDDGNDETTEQDSIKDLVIEALKDPLSRVVYNYDRGGIGQGPLGHGHWSPLGGYHEATDSFLVMDVAKYKHPMVWVSWPDLWSGAATTDFCATTLSLDETRIDWKAPGSTGLYKYLQSRCIPGHRGFVVVRPLDGEL